MWKDGYHCYINCLVTVCFRLFAFPTLVSVWRFVEEINGTAYAIYFIHWALAERVIEAYWIHRSCYQPGASSIINILTVKITEVFPCSFWVITMFFLAWGFFRLLLVKNVIKLIFSFFSHNSVHRIKWPSWATNVKWWLLWFYQGFPD